MKWEHKIGIALTCTFLCLIGAVIGLKMQDQTHSASPKLAEVDPAKSAPKPDTNAPIPLGNLEMPPLESGSPAPNANTNGEPPNRDSLANRNAKQEPIKDNFPMLGAGKNDKNATPLTEKNVAPSERKQDTRTPPPLVERPPTASPVAGANEWGMYSNGSKEKKQSPTPPTPINDSKSASPTLSFPEVKKQPSPNQPPSMIMPASNMEPVLAPAEPQPKPVAAPPKPQLNPLAAQPKSQPNPIAAPSASPAAPSSPGLGAGSPPTPAMPANPVKNAPPPAMAMPSYLSQPSSNAPKPPDPKEKEKNLLSSIPTPNKSPMMPTPLTSSTQTPSPMVNPAIVSPMPAAPAPVPAPTVPPPSTTMPRPVTISGPISTPAPTPPAPASPAPVSPVIVSPIPAPAQAPPKPPEGSSFIPDNSSTAPGPVGVRPAPLPFPTPPPSSPLAAAPQAPVSPRPASPGPSVTVYDEQDYSCRPGDTWEALSKRFYMTDRYAKALQRHNQLHARASERMKDSGQLVQGERIFVPQSYVLENHYGDAIAKPAPAPAATAMPATFVAPNGAPPPQRP